MEPNGKRFPHYSFCSPLERGKRGEVTHMTAKYHEKITTGIEGLDSILEGGFPKDQFVLIQGGPGTGKTTLGLQFLLDGIMRGERGLYLSFLHNRKEIELIARSHGWDLEGIEVEELLSAADAARAAGEQTIFHSAHVELSETIDEVHKIVEQVSPKRLVFDSLSELLMLSDTLFRCRHQVVALKRLLSKIRCTSLFTIGGASSESETEFDNLSYGLVKLEQATPGYGVVRRTLEVVKMRGMRYRSGRHDFRIKTGGLEVYPRLQTFCEHTDKGWEKGGAGIRKVLKSGVRELDTLLGGGLEFGTTTLVLGASGVGKSTLSAFYACAAARQGMKAAIFLFDENLHTYCERARGIGLDLARFIEEGLVLIRRINIGEISPGQFSEIIRSCVEIDNIGVIVIDTLTGYASAMPQKGELLTLFHELLAYTGTQSILSFLLVEEHGLFGKVITEPRSMSLLSDTVLLLSFFEAQGRIRRAISVFKKRFGDHEKTIREFSITSDGIRVGQPLDHFSGVLSGIPSFSGKQGELMEA